MNHGFPVKLIDYIRCSKDEGILELIDPHDDNASIFQGRIKCQECGSIYKIKEGVLDLFDKRKVLDPQSLYELYARDAIAKKSHADSYQEANLLDEMEISSTIRRMGNIRGKSIVEIGCGTGRYTRQLAESCDSIIAVDFSKESLFINSKLMPQKNNVRFVHADISKLNLKPNSFDLSFSTLYSNFPSFKIRSASTKKIYNALKPNGRYILSAHHHDIRERLRGIPAEGQYNNGIYYKSFTAKSLQAELQDYFSNIEYTTICIWVPYISRIQATRVFVSKLCERIPLINKMGSLLLATATKI